MLVTATFLTMATKLTLLGLLVTFGFWAYRRLRLRTLPWVGCYLLLSGPLNILEAYVTRAVIEESLPLATPFGMTPGEFIFLWSAGRDIVDGVIGLLVAGLLISDVIFVLTTAGIDVDWRPAQFLLQVRRSSTAWGIALLGLLLVAPLAAVGILVT